MRTNESWLRDLQSNSPAHELALEELRQTILGALPYALSGYLSPENPQFEALAEETAQETVLKVMANLKKFEGRSQFTTWVYKIAVRVALTELRRKRWKDASLDEMMESSQPGAMPTEIQDHSQNPELAVVKSDMMARIDSMMEEELTRKQMQAMRLLGMDIPMDETAQQMGMTRNALYKLMHDARVKVKKRLAREHLKPEEILAIFEEP